MAPVPNNKDAWIRRLQKTPLPSFAQNIEKLSNSEKFVDSHSSELARIILKDPSLTASVLKLANSVQFNTYGNTIRTVSRGVMVLGHKMIKDICTGCLLLEKFLKGRTSDTLKSILARSFHAAIQAKELANIRGDKGVEEIFISTLLLNIGEISVYASILPSDRLIAKLASNYPLENGKEKDIIGCYFNELTSSLCRSWGIAPMIGDVVNGNYKENSVSRSILLANSFSLSCEKEGLNAAISSHVKTISRYCKVTPDEIKERLLAAAETSKKILNDFGLSLPGGDFDESAIEKAQSFEIIISKSYQLQIISELSSLIQNSFDLNIALQLVLEGLSKGAGFCCCLVALLNPQRSRISAKHIIDLSGSKVKQAFDFNCATQIPEIQHKVITNKEIILLSELREKGKTRKEVTSQLKHHHSIWGPLIVENQVIGCLYADNGKSDLEISEEQHAAFQLFTYQATSNLRSLNNPFV